MVNDPKCTQANRRSKGFPRHSETCVSPEQCRQVFLSLRIQDPALHPFLRRRSYSKSAGYEMACRRHQEYCTRSGIFEFCLSSLCPSGEQVRLLSLERKACFHGGHVWDIGEPGVRRLTHASTAAVGCMYPRGVGSGSAFQSRANKPFSSCIHKASCCGFQIHEG